MKCIYCGRETEHCVCSHCEKERNEIFALDKQCDKLNQKYGMCSLAININIVFLITSLCMAIEKLYINFDAYVATHAILCILIFFTLAIVFGIAKEIHSDKIDARIKQVMKERHNNV